MTPSEIAHLVSTVQGYFDKKAYLPNTRLDQVTPAKAEDSSVAKSKRSELEALLRDQQAMLRDLQQAADATKELMDQTTKMLEKTI